MASPDVAGMIEEGTQGNEDPSQLGGDSQQQSQETSGTETGSPPIADPSQEGTNPWDSIDPKEPGPPRRDHERAIHNARQQAAEELLGGRSRQDVQSALALADMARDPQSLLAYTLSQYPELRQALLTPQQPQQQPQQPQRPEYPKPVLDQYTGQYYYSAQQLEQIRQLDQQALMQEVQAQFDQRLQPFEQQSQVTEQARAANAQLDLYETTLPGFKEILESGELRKELDKDRRATVLTAYNRVFQNVYEPARRARERKELMDSLNKKAGAKTEGRPTGGSGSQLRKPQDFQKMRGQAGWDAAFAEAEAEATSS